MSDEQALLALDEEWQTALAVVAHPDDLEYGAASAVSKWTSEGKTVAYLLATRGEAGIDGMLPDEARKVRSQEEIEGAKVVGVDTVEFLDYTDGVVEYGLPLRRDIARAILRHKPEVVVTINFDLRFAQGMANQADHRAVGARRAGRLPRRGQPVDIPGTAGRGAGAVGRSPNVHRRRVAEPDARGGRGGSHMEGRGVSGETRCLHKGAEPGRSS